MKYISSKDLKCIIERYIERIKDFYKYELNDVSMKESLRHIEIIRTQISSDIKLISIDNELESQFIYSILSDSYYFEKNKSESLEWKINFLRITWKRLLDDLGIDTSKMNSEILKNTYVDSTTREDGRYIYEKYKNNQ